MRRPSRWCSRCAGSSPPNPGRELGVVSDRVGADQAGDRRPSTTTQQANGSWPATISRAGHAVAATPRRARTSRHHRCSSPTPASRATGSDRATFRAADSACVFNVVDVGRRTAAGQICVSKSARIDLYRTDGDLRPARGPLNGCSSDNQQALAGAKTTSRPDRTGLPGQRGHPDHHPVRFNRGATGSWSTSTTPSTPSSSARQRFASRRRAHRPLRRLDRPSTTPTTVTCALKGATPNQVEARAGFTPQPPTLTSDIPPDFTDLSGQVEWIRLNRL